MYKATWVQLRNLIKTVLEPKEYRLLTEKLKKWYGNHRSTASHSEIISKRYGSWEEYGSIKKKRIVGVGI